MIISAHTLSQRAREGLLARHRPRAPIIAFSADEAVRRRLGLVWGVSAVALPSVEPLDAVLSGLREAVRATGVVQEGAPVVLIGGWPFGGDGVANFVHVTKL